jgi:hypothetical protein
VQKWQVGDARRVSSIQGLVKDVLTVGVRPQITSLGCTVGSQSEQPASAAFSECKSQAPTPLLVRADRSSGAEAGKPYMLA